MYREPSSSSGSGASTKGDEVELVSRFLAPLCARDEAARNIALAAARTTVEGWLGGVSSPNRWEDAGDIEDIKTASGKFSSSQDGRYDMSIERSPTRSSPRSVLQQQQQQQQQQLLHDTFRTEGFFPQSINDNPLSFLEENNPECSFDCVDGRLLNERRFRERYASGDGVESCRSGHSTSSDEGSKSFNIEGRCPRFGSNSETERKHPGSSSSDRSTSDDYCSGRTKNNYVKVKGAKQKQLEDDELDADTRVYGKSPKFDDNLSGLASFDCRNLNRRAKIVASGDLLTHEQRRYYDAGTDDDVSFNDSEAARSDGVVFNTLDGFENENDLPPFYHQDMNLENRETAVYDDIPEDSRRTQQDYLRKNDERKFSAGQIKRPLSQDEDVSSKSGRVLESPEVTPGDVGRMLNLGNALDGPRQAQANKYLSLVTLHLPVILRLSVNCPFQNVRIKCAEILQMVKRCSKQAAKDGLSLLFVIIYVCSLRRELNIALYAVSQSTQRHSDIPEEKKIFAKRPMRKITDSLDAAERGLPVPVPAFDGPSAFVPLSEVKYKMMLMQEPGWKLERKGSGAQVLRKDGSHFKSSTARVCFRCDVEIREFVPDEDYGVTENMEMETAASPLAMLSSCVAALCVTILLPWLLIGG
ncbi:hypothetical protein ALC56_02022 [Trachymyrmex septentrionalis]|uniref:Uncharacterized protein n=1 Tax=Trachymyrmex septentrionalis TaxID=34720 RepID=A0A195FV65_9HYME|nr:hypothetical protein ALC56_02022 [Trachymyrmex septentrionalis]